MPIETDFAFSHHLHPGSLVTPDKLGLLRGFVGNSKKRSWKGTGFNMIWRPNHGQSGTQDFFLELNITKETIDFTDITGSGVANRGFRQVDIGLGAVGYLQQIKDKNGGQHFEPGVWANVPPTTDPAEPPTVVRMGSIPHGTSVNLQGQAIDAGAAAPIFAASSITPFTIGSLDDGNTGLVHFPEEKNVTTAMPSRTNPADVTGLDDAHLANPNLFLKDAIAGQTFLSNHVISITSDVKAAKSPPGAPPVAPDTGGGSPNIAFLDGTAAGPNALVSRVTATFWIEHVRDKHGKIFDQLQYTQRVLLNFNGLSWPHVTVATLR